MQTSGRSLHAQEMDFNDIRTTLQALCAIYDNANSLHTNAYDEAVTTPTEQSVRRALAIQMIIEQEWGPAGCENPMQGSYLVSELTDLVEAAVLAEFERLSDRGGVLGAMETGYQRGRIQDESMAYEQRKNDGSLPIIGVNTFLATGAGHGDAATVPLARGPTPRSSRSCAGWPTSPRPTPTRPRQHSNGCARSPPRAATPSRRSWTPSGSARSVRSPRRSSRSAASTVARYEWVGAADGKGRGYPARRTHWRSTRWPRLRGSGRPTAGRRLPAAWPPSRR